MLAFDVSKSASVVVNSAQMVGNDLNQIQEETRFDPDDKELVISKPSSVDTGLNEISRLQRKKGIRRKKTRSSQSIDRDEELAPLHIPEPPVLEPAVVILRKPKVVIKKHPNCFCFTLHQSLLFWAFQSYKKCQ